MRNFNVLRFHFHLMLKLTFLPEKFYDGVYG